MKRVKNVLIVLAGISFTMAGISYAQPDIPKEKIPSDIPSDVRAQIERLYSSDPAVRGHGAYTLGNMGERAAPATLFLIGILNDYASLEWRSTSGSYSSTSPGKEAKEALGKIGQPAVPALVAALKDEDSDVRRHAAWGLGEVKDPRAVEPLIAALKDKDSHVRGAAAWELGMIKDPRAIEPLIAALKDKDSGGRGAAAWALGMIKDPRAIEPLIAALKDEDSDVRNTAAWALKGITGLYFGVDYASWQRWWEIRPKEVNR